MYTYRNIHSYSNINYQYTCMRNLFYNCNYFFYFLLINTLIKPYDKNVKQHIIEKRQGIIANIKNKGDISKIILSSSGQLHNDILSSVIFVIFIYILLNLILLG